MATTNNKKSGCGCLSILAVIALAAGGIYYWRGELLGKKLTPLQAAEAIPQEALLTSYIATDAQAWSQLSKFGTPEAQKVLAKQVDEFRNNLSTGDINYVQDIEPWLGGVMLALMPSNIANEPEVLIVAGIKNKLKAKEFQEKLKNQYQQNTQKTDYKGITISTITPPNSSPFNVANMGNYLILADKIQTVEEAIDTLKGDPSYADKPGAKQVLSQSLSLKRPVAQVYLIDYVNLIQQQLQNSSPNTSIPPNTLKQLEQIESIVVGVGLEDEGLHFQAIAKFSPSAIKLTSTSGSGKIIEQFPAQTFALISGHGIKEGWSNLVTTAQNDQDLQLGLSQIRQGFASLNFDFDKDIVSWMDGEFAMGMVFSNQSSIPQVPVGGMLIWETSDRASAENTFNKLNQMAQLYSISVQPNQVNGVAVTDWKIERQNLLLSYGWLDQDSLAVTIGMPFSTATNVKSNNSLAQSQNFEKITSSLPKKNSGYFYLDLNQTMDQMINIAKQQGTTPDPDTLAILNSIYGLAATANMPNQTTSQFDLLLALKSSQ